MSYDATCVWREKRFGNRIAQVVDLTYGRARIILFREGDPFLMDGW